MAETRTYSAGRTLTRVRSAILRVGQIRFFAAPRFCPPDLAMRCGDVHSVIPRSTVFSNLPQSHPERLMIFAVETHLTSLEAGAAAESSVNFSGKWRNQLDSEMEIATDASGRVTGRYRTNVGSPKPTEEFDLTGFVTGDLIVFCVNFGKYGSATSWAGQHTRDGGSEKIYTLWHLAQNIPDASEETGLWRGVLAGADTFFR
jgi:hypothetical protein